ncbi:MAG TPA: YetF domain-containing protein [Euzebyales bacterium]|nr:YetF domain-containing protein [Euzebyales bacterium]
MDAIARALAVYLFLLVLFRVSGKRTLAEASNFDFVLLLIVAEATQQALLGDDFSVTNSILIITTLFLTDVAATWLKNRSDRFDRLIDGLPVLLMDRGAVLHSNLDEHRINVNDILEEARRDHGLRSLEDIEYAVLERSGDISVIPRTQERA